MKGSFALPAMSRFTLEKMLNRDKKAVFLHRIHLEPVWAHGVVLNCAVCLLILISLAWFGTGIDLRRIAPIATLAADVPAQQRERASVVEARKVFDERRARFDGQSSKRQATDSDSTLDAYFIGSSEK
jgi:hypothetical protein